MNKFIASFGLVTIALSLGACSGSRGRQGAAQCPKNFNPIQMDLPVVAKSEVRAESFVDGTYRPVRSWLFFKGDATAEHPEGFQVMVKDDVPEKSKSATPVPRSSCFRNAAVDRPYSAKASALSELVIENGRVKSTSAHAFGFEMDENGQFKLISGGAEAKSTAVGELFAGSSETFVMHYNDSLYEIRTKARGENGEWTMSTVLVRHP